MLIYFTDFNMQESLILGILVLGVICALGLVCIYASSRNKKNYKKVGTVSKLYVRPVKSMSAIEVQEGELTDSGFLCCGVYDKSFVVVDENDHFVTARRCPKMILIKPSFSDDNDFLILSAEGQNDIRIPLQQNGPGIPGRVKEIDEEGRDCGDDIAKWLSDYLDGTYRLVFFSTGLLGKQLPKNVSSEKFGRHKSQAVFQYCGTFNLLSEASVEDLNSRLEEKVPEKNFRPNIYVRGCPPYAEDFWKYVKVGEKAEMVFTHFCGRCSLINLDQSTGKYKSLEPLKTLREYRQVYDFVEDPHRQIYASKPIFGTFLDLETRGMVKVGDPVFATFQFQEYTVHAAQN
ncbi:Mitochondrial amidoxime reducing component 2 [Holothuria leucospilota]|uniref:Mitochondrial amidoxime reducing component 2 n=1 Tax=Holothuria leucospilota TaxID=206669 RepID=A0A9Q1CJ14_HOLLE|nr:Mitochondrial amidoxime reducing component 2 [Holothuria leucospilota]